MAVMSVIPGRSTATESEGSGVAAGPPGRPPLVADEKTVPKVWLNMTSQISGMKRLKNRRTGVLVSFTRLRHVTRPTSVRTPPVDSASRVPMMTRCACPTSVTMLSPPPSERPRHRLHFLDAHLPPGVLQEDLVERGMSERDLMNGDLLRVKSAQDFEKRPAAVRGVRTDAFVEDRGASDTGDRAGDFESPGPTLLERLVAGNPDRDDVQIGRAHV